MAKRKEKASGPVPDTNMEAHILAIAEQLFVEKGHALTSTTEIARQAGCNQALVHYYFRTKERLFNIVLRDKIRHFFSEFMNVEAGEGSFEEKLARMIGLHFDTIRRNSSMMLFLINEFTRNPEQFEEVFRDLSDVASQTLASFQNDLQEEIRTGRIREISVATLLLNAVSLNAFAFLVKPVFARIWQADEEQMERMLEERKEEVIRTILSSLKP